MQLAMGGKLFTIIYLSSPPPPSPDPRIQVNNMCFTIKISKKLRCRWGNIVWNVARIDENAGHGGGWNQTMPVDNYHKNGGTMAIVYRLC